MSSRRPVPTIRLRRLAAELRKLRKDAGLTRDEVTARTALNPATLWRIETAKTRPQARTLRTLLELYGASEERCAELAALLRESARRGWVHAVASGLRENHVSYIEFEGSATRVSNYESSLVPGLLQTEEYARAAIAGIRPEITEAEVDHRVGVRMRRQEVLTASDPLELRAVLDEAVLRRRVGGAELMSRQAEHLLEASSLRNVTLQVVPFTAGAHPGMAGAFVVMEFPEDAGSGVAYVDGQGGDAFLEEEADVQRCQQLFDRLRAMALSPRASAALITRAVREFRKERTP
ncbi:XRE family transcriptional regulator [Actinomadura logoneensis]|uniref:XRE family transcriptional regulator n=1 Tax=Actinomadura logoneensis TaxID=2293572 RepID=A0A372JA44_9ACTN|nr:helix-turn-helix transcriptional regulator [Actinomadura logoneensis]RFU36686.1 XRE family transcriptional regulator [Actinomadura logoneensis]